MRGRPKAKRCPPFLVGGGEMGAFIREHDWAASSLGPPANWPQPLKTVVRLILNTGHPMYIWWGSDLVCFYNDAYRASIGPERHPGSLGRRGRKVWDEIWPIIGPQIDQVMSGGGATWHENQLVPITRHGRLEEVYWTYSYGPIDDENAPNGVGGVLVICTETTGQVLAERRRTSEADRLRQMFEQAPGAVAVFRGPTHVFEIVNPAYTAMVGGRDVVGRTLAEALPEVVDQGFEGLLDQVYRTGEPFVGRAMPVDLVRKDSPLTDRRLLDFVYQPITEGGAVTGIFVQATDVTDSIAAEADRERAAALTAAQSRVLELAVREAPLVETLDAIIATVEALSQAGMLGSILLLEEEGTRLRHGAAPSLPAAYNKAIDGIKPGPAAGSCGTAVHTRQQVVVSDIATDPLWIELRDLALMHGLRACWSVPIMSREHVVLGTFAMYYREPRAANPADLALVEFVVNSATLVIERKRAETDLRDSETRYRTLFTSSTAAFGVFDIRFDELQRAIDHRFIEINPAFSELTGLTECVGRWASELAPGIAQYWLDAYGRVALTGTPVRFESFVKPLDRCYDVLVFRAGARDEHRVAVLFNDITAQRHAQEQLRTLNETLEARVAESTAERDRLWRTSQDLLLIARFDATILAVNPAWTELLGWTEAELVGTSFMPLIHPDDLMASAAEADRLSAEGRTTMRFENRYHAKDGRWIWLSWAVSSESGAFHGVARDITSEKQRQAELEAAQEALRQSQKMEAMGQLTGGVAHDFNNLLTPIVGSLDMLRRKGLGTEREQRLIAGAIQSADRAKTLVQRLLAFARRQPLQPTAVDVATLVTGMADLVSSTTGPQIRVVVDAAENLPPAHADLNQLEMALLNLSVNARDAMPDGGTLRISASVDQVGRGHRSGLKSGPFILLSVADTGIGMDETTLQRAIEPFFSTKGIGKGTGLGLSMVHGLASQLGGALAIQSRRGLGTNIELWLPQSASAPAVTERPSDIHPRSPTRGTALLVDDEELVRLSTADMLIDLGYAVVETSSAEQARNLIDGGLEFDLLITDHLMPGMSGTDLARLVQTARPDVGILIVSGYAEREGLDPDLPRLNKPFRNDELLASLASLSPSG